MLSKAEALGYSSLFDYATRGLGYSPSAAQRRIKAARALSVFPEIYERLVEGALSLTVIEAIADVLTVKNARQLVQEVSGKSRDEAIRILACYLPVSPVRLSDKIEPLVVRMRKESSLPELPPFNPDENPIYFRREPSREVRNRELPLDNTEQAYRVSFTASAEFMEKLERARELASGRYASSELESVLTKVLDEYISRHDPVIREEKRAEKRKQRELKKGELVLSNLDSLSEVSEVLGDTAKQDPALNRYPSDALRDKVLTRDGNCCTYVSPEGVRCNARHNLELDHIEPWAFGGRTEEGNLRTLCRAHNHMFARQCFGDRHIEAILESRKPGKDGRPTVFVKERDILDPAEQLLFGR